MHFIPKGVRYNGILNSNEEEKTLTLKMSESDNLNGKVKVKVVGLDNSTPVPGAKVTMKITGLPNAVQYTDSNGEFLFSLIKPGNFVVEAENMLVDQYNTLGIINAKSGYMGYSGGQEVNITIKLKGSVTLHTVVKKWKFCCTRCICYFKNSRFPCENLPENH